MRKKGKIHLSDDQKANATTGVTDEMIDLWNAPCDTPSMTVR